MDPSDPANYFALAKIYEDAGNYEQAEATLLKARDARPEGRDRLHAAGGLLQPPGTVRQDDGSAESARGRRSRTTPRATTRSPPTTGTRPSATRRSRTPRSASTSARASRRPTRPSRSRPTTSRPSSTRACCSGSQATMEKDRKQQEDADEGSRRAARAEPRSLQKSEDAGGRRTSEATRV